MNKRGRDKWQRAGTETDDGLVHRRRPRNVGYWVPLNQLCREIGQAHRRWLATRATSASVLVVHRRKGAPKCPKVGAAIAEWRLLGCPARGFHEICRRHGANYSTAVIRRQREGNNLPPLKGVAAACSGLLAGRDKSAFLAAQKGVL